MRKRSDRVLALAALLAAASLGAWACVKQKPPAEAEAEEETRPVELPKDDQSRCDYRGRGDRDVSEVAGPGSLTHNIRRVYALTGEGEESRRVLVCREVDTNFDGIKDVVRTYNDRGEAMAEQADSNFDGRIDTWVTFARGRVAKVEVDTTRNGKPDEARYYVVGKLSRVQLDLNDDGRTDVWEIYDDGKLQRRGVDLDHDGRVDRWDRDELALREIAERERREEAAARKKEEEKERRKSSADAGAGTTKSSADAGAVDAAERGEVHEK
jgi:hypothetical protein